MGKMIALLNLTDTGVLTYVSAGLLVVCVLCGAWTRKKYFGLAVFLWALAIIFLEMTVLAVMRPSFSSLLTVVVAVETMVLTVVIIVQVKAAFYAHFHQLATESGAASDASESDVPGEELDRNVTVCYILPDRTDEEIKMQFMHS